MVRLYTLFALSIYLSCVAAQHFRPGFGSPGMLDCVLGVNTLFPKIAKTIVDSQKTQRECTDCRSNSVLADGNSSRAFTGWEGAKEKLEKECAAQDAEVCMASVSIMNVETSRRFFMKDYTPTCKPKKCNLNEFGFFRALRRFSRDKPSNLFWYPPAESDPILDACNQSNNCIFVFDFCGQELSLSYDASTIESFDSAVAASVAQTTADIVSEGIITDKNESTNASSNTDANESADANDTGLPVGAIIGIVAGVVVIVLAIVFALVRSKKSASEEFN